VKQGQQIGGTPTPPMAPWQRRANELRKEIANLRESADARVAKAKADMQVLVDAACMERDRARANESRAVTTYVDATTLWFVQYRGFFGRLAFRLRYLFTGRIA